MKKCEHDGLMELDPHLDMIRQSDLYTTTNELFPVPCHVPRWGDSAQNLWGCSTDLTVFLRRIRGPRKLSLNPIFSEQIPLK